MLPTLTRKFVGSLALSCGYHLYFASCGDSLFPDPDQFPATIAQLSHEDEPDTPIADGTGDNACQAMLDLLLSLCAEDARFPLVVTFELQRLGGDAVAGIAGDLTREEAPTPG